MIIDTHSQLFTTEAIDAMPAAMADSYRAMFKDLKPPEIGDTIADMDAAGVDMAVIVGIDAETTFHYKVGNDLVEQAVSAHPDRLIGFAGADPHKGRLACDELERGVRRQGLRGLKLLPHLAELRPNDRKWYPLYELARDLNIPVLLHTGTQFHAGTRIKYGMPVDLDDVAIDFPGLTLIMAHFGYPWFYEAMAVVMRNPGVYFNIAGWAPKYIPEPVIRHLNGPLKYKALFGSDYPLLTRPRIISELAQLPLSDTARQLLMSDNPKRVLGIS